MSPAAVLDRVTGRRGALAIKYSMVSVVGVTLTQLMLVLLVGILDLNPTWSHVAAASITAIPVIFLNNPCERLHYGTVSLRSETLTYWVFPLSALLLSNCLFPSSTRVSAPPIPDLA